MFITIENEASRKEAAIQYVEDQIQDLKRCIGECDYIEDVNGNLIYEPGSYAEEKREYNHQLIRWECILKILKADYKQQIYLD